MAKISANGATEVGRIKGKNEITGSITLYVLCSDGRLLSRYTGDLGTGFTVMARKVPAAKGSPTEIRTYLESILKRHRLVPTR